MKECIHIVCAIDDSFVPHCGTMLASLFFNNQGDSFHIHILSMNLLPENRIELKDFIGLHFQGCSFYLVNDELFKAAPVDGHIKRASYYKIIIPDLLPRGITKVLYLDSDLIIRERIVSLWNADLGRNVIGAAEEPMPDEHLMRLQIAASESYFNAGVMLINLSLWREENYTEKCMRFIRSDKLSIKYHDQDVLNVVLKRKWFAIEKKWNVGHRYFYNSSDLYSDIEKEELKQLKKNPGVVHFSGYSKPWSYWNSHPFKTEYLNYCLTTPWKNEAKFSLKKILLETYAKIKVRSLN